jgi:hypothetical protein
MNESESNANYIKSYNFFILQATFLLTYKLDFLETGKIYF